MLHRVLEVAQQETRADKAALLLLSIGIPPDETDKIFERFYQVEDSLTRKHEGIGLGLAIVKSMVELGGGRVWVESELGKGSTFTFTIPQPVAAPERLER